MHPNPVGHMARLTLESEKIAVVEAEIIDFTGNSVWFLGEKLQVEGRLVKTLNLGNLRAGIYILKIRSGKEIITKKFIKL